MRFLYRFKLYDGTYPEAKGESWQEAAESIGLDPANIKRFMPVKWIDRPTMSEEIKEKLKAMKQERKENPDPRIYDDDGKLRSHFKDDVATRPSMKQEKKNETQPATKEETVERYYKARKEWQDVLTEAVKPSVDYTEAGPQYVIPTTPARKISAEPLRAKRVQKTTPIELETPAIEAQQGRLF